MVEIRARPRGRVVALRTGLREAGLHVIRLGRALEILQVAADTSRISAGQVVVAVHVAAGAGDGRVRPGQREPGGRVIEGRIAPGRRRMALLASLREIRLHVIRIGRALEVLQVAAHARGVRVGQAVIPVHVALRALQRRVCAGQREARCGVVETRARPRRGVVALLAGLREVRLYVVRLRCPLEIL